MNDSKFTDDGWLGDSSFSNTRGNVSKTLDAWEGGIWGEGGMRQKTGGVMSRIVRRAGGGGGGECIRHADLDHTGNI